MEKLKDAEILARLIYRAYIAPDPHAPLEAEALLPFQAALELYARVWQHDREVAVKLEELRNICVRCLDKDDDEPCGDACPIKFPEPDVSDSDREPAPEAAADPPDTHTHTAGTNDGGELTPRLFAGYGAGEKREVYARLMAFVATHGLGARRKIAEATNGALQLSDIQDMTDAKRVPLPKWRLAAAAMDWIEEQERQETEDCGISALQTTSGKNTGKQ